MRHRQVVAPQHADHRLEHPDVEAAAVAHVHREEAPEVRLEAAHIGAGRRRSDREDGTPEQRGIIQLRREQHPPERLQRDGIEHAGRAEVEHHERAVVLDQDVPGMRVGVEDAVGEHLGQERTQQPVRTLLILRAG